MFGKLIAAVAGQQASRYVSGIGGTQGALLGAGLAMVLRRLGPAGLVAAAAGGYVLKKHYDKRQDAVTPAYAGASAPPSTVG